MTVSYVTLQVMQRTASSTTIPLDEVDLRIISLLSNDCRLPFRNIGSTIGISPNAVKVRVKKMVDKGIIQNFIVRVNPAIFGYEKICTLIARYIGKTIKEEDHIFNRLKLLGDLWAYAKQIGGSALFFILVKSEAEDKIELMSDLLKPTSVEYRILAIKPSSMNVSVSDLKIIKCLLPDARMEIAEIAKESSLSPRTVTRRIEKMSQNHILDFSIIRDMSSMQLVGYIEFALIVSVNGSAYGEIVERIYREMQEYGVIMSSAYQSEVIVAVFFCANIPTVDSIVTRVQSYDKVQHVELFITTKLAYHQEWLGREINKRLRSEVKATPAAQKSRKYSLNESYHYLKSDN
jgi:DNA-binding Lrp family transcriptional regulator